MVRLLACALLIAALVTTTASAHLERPSYWPDPAPDTAVTPPAGGEVPKARSLASAVRGKGPGEVRVVCQDNSLERALASIRRARTRGFRVRPSQPKIHYGKKKARQMKRFNRALDRQCEYSSVQQAVFDSGNNDRVVVMPGVYTEPDARSKPLNDPLCRPDLLQQDASGEDTPSYAYQVTCPNDQNLIHVAGRALFGEPLDQPRADRQGIPDVELGACIRCNLQIEGSGAKPTDVILDAGKGYTSKGATARPLKHGQKNDDGTAPGHAKHVVLRVDRADGFVGRNFTTRGGLEHGFYAEEVDGVLLDRVHFYWNADYGHLSFTSDHAVVQNCDAMGAGDAGVYPGAAPETGSQATSFYPDAPRYNTVIRKCDLRNNHLGFSGSMGNAVRITNNHIYGNATGVTSDTLSSAGHPGFPSDSSKIDNNFFYSNNFDVFGDDSPVRPLVGAPIGSGIVYAGMNDARVHDNWFFDNWRDGALLLAVPDAITSAGGPEGEVYDGVSCPGAPENGISTSCGNHFFNNKMGQVPAGFRFPRMDPRFAVAHSTGSGPMPNGNDFWWDEFQGNTANCWFNNTGFDGQAGSVTGSGDAGESPGTPPNPLPDCAGGSEPSMSVGQGDPAKTQYLVDCGVEGPDEETGPLECDWWRVPPKPGSDAARRRIARFNRAAIAFSNSAEGAQLQQRIEELSAGG